MNWYEGVKTTSQQKPHNLSVKSLINLVLAKLPVFSIRLSLLSISLALFSISLTSIAQQAQQEHFYLDHSFLVNRHLTDNIHSDFDAQNNSFRNGSTLNIDGHGAELESYDVEFKNYSLEDADPYYFAFDSDNCHIDPFTSSEDGSENKRILATCLKNQLWQNDNIPLWIRATGATVLIGAASSAGKVDDDLKFTMGFDRMDSILRDWLSNKEQ